MERVADVVRGLVLGSLLSLLAHLVAAFIFVVVLR
jgi:hypothetical protein